MLLDTDSGEIEQLFIWKVILPGVLQNHKDLCVKSPHFRFLDSTLQLSLGTKYKGWIGFYLMVDSGSPMNVTFALEISTKGGCKTQFTKSHIFESSNTSSGEPKVLEMSKMNPSEERGFHELEITCRIINYSSDALQEIPNCVSCGNEAEILDGVSCAMQKAIPNSFSGAIETNQNSGTKEEKLDDKVWPLLYKKNTPNSVSCGNQAEILDGATCVVQKAIPSCLCGAIETKNPNNGTKEEKLDGKVWQLLDKKKDTLNSVSCAIQTEVTDNVSCANQTENLNSVSCAIQTVNLTSVSCAIQTQIPDSFSCEVQTESPDSETDKENSEDDGWSSLDRKEVNILRDCLKELLTKGNNQDVTINVQGRKFRAHRSILIARSPVFAMMLTHDTKENNTGIISIVDCDPESFEEFLLYVYSGRTGNITPSKAFRLYYTSDKYDFPVLKERCVSLLKTFLSITSICDVIVLAIGHGEKELLKVATEFFSQNIKEIINTVAWQNFLARNPVEANELFITSLNKLLP